MLKDVHVKKKWKLLDELSFSIGSSVLGRSLHDSKVTTLLGYP